MSFSKEEEEVEDILCILDHLQILSKEIKKIKNSLTRTKKIPTKIEIKNKLKIAKKEVESIIKRLNFMIKDLKN